MRGRLGSIAWIGLLIGLSPTAAPAQEVADNCPSVVPASEQPVPHLDQPQQLEAVHQFATGAGIRVAVIDTGVSNHPRLGGVEDGGDFVDKASAHRDCDAHGTIVAGVIAARPGPDTVVGVAPDAQVVSIRQTSALSRRNDRDANSLATLVAAINRAVELRADVINISVVSCVPRQAAGSLNTSSLAAALARAEDAGAVVVAAAGNTGNSCDADSIVFPAHSPTVLAVSASKSTHELAEYSVAPPSAPISAPGTVDLALDPRSTGLATGVSGSQGPTSFTGTSFAAPFVAGVAALIKQRYPDESPAQVRERIRAAASPGTGAVDPLWAVAYLPADSARNHPVALKVPGPSSRLSEHRAQVVLATLLAGGVLGSVLLSVARTLRR
ncbi:type VII secretion-associated serine protease mycosin [Corynebacterium epidermidicanis]|uniref:Type VII secretion-associated serine protease mycosin n=1 Tax=Corynebacterium epidermidicanis TaxID=1050174 RepID=A0A0G3GM61_9CORY|nr:type VII secretion-associated serine protease mycosin [Corynebacterium epidermidicanis]AKK02321.1 type VII secretion-associated serine protease mycosin [Corynebacterium epidermidicanis]